MLKKVSKILIALFAVLFVSVACSLFAVSETALADGGVVVEMTSTLTEIKSSEPNKEFTVSAKVKNPAGSELFGGQITIEFDVAVFEYVDVVKNTALKTSDIDRSTQAQKLWPQGIYTIRADQDGEPISLTEWDMGGIKLKLKNGVSPTVGAQSEIRFSECLLADMLGDDVNATFSTDSIDVSFTAASNLCELQTLSVNGQSLTGSGNTFTYNAPYSYNKLSNVVYTASQGATVTFSPELNSDLTDANTPVTITVTAEDKVTTNEYTLNVNRAAAETVNNLTSLILKNGTTQIYTKANADLLGQDLTFTVDEPVAYADRNQLSLQFNKSGSYSTVESFIDNTSKGSNTQFSLGNLASGDHTVQVKVTAQSGVTNTYTIKFTIAAADVTKTLSSLKIELLNGTPVNLTPDFSPEVFNYSATVPFGTEKVKVTATVDAPLSKITGDGEQPVNDSIKVTVKAEDGSSYTYTIVVAPEKDTSGLQLIDTKAFVVEADGITEHMLNITGTSLDNYFKITIPYQYANLTKFIIRADWGDKTYTVEGINTVMQIPESSEHRVRFVKGGVEERFIVFDIIRETNEVTLAKLTYNDVTITLTDATDYS
ncbi:MAG: cadherin-like beta sandwich domain-containing protein, partial [Clostridia bacterium]|nr:cadherin-like beta sandwich domain-containing protein [Clostridia bacterium]